MQAFDATDAHIGQIVNKMKANNVYNDTLIIVASKHGQGSIDPSLYAKIDPQLLADTITVPTAWITVRLQRIFSPKHNPAARHDPLTYHTMTR